ncbi:hypothetical protein [Azospirillum sp. ST 5-10]|uniref:hypothetical protein n=1 Tax=unclassified Azospirillum TaxID=2630922 RepID=UPI003F49CB3E
MGALPPLTALALAANGASLGRCCGDAERARLTEAVAAVAADPPPPGGFAGTLLAEAIAFLDGGGGRDALGRAAAAYCASVAPCQRAAARGGATPSTPAATDAQMTFAALAAEAMGE